MTPIAGRKNYENQHTYIAALPKTFDQLASLHPLRPICDEIDLENAYEVMDRLAVLNKRTKDQNDYLKMLILITEDYDKQDNAVAMNAARKVSPVEALKYLMQNTNMPQTQLAKLLGVGPSAASLILSAHRPITANHARRLGKHFGVDAGLFL